MVDAELLRPRSWVEANGLEVGRLLPIDIEELQIEGTATVTAIEAAPAIATGEGSAVTGRFITRRVDEICRIQVLGADGQIDTIEGTTIHPIWSVDRDDWVPLGELQEGEQLLSSLPSPHMGRGIEGEGQTATILAHQVLHRTTPVYNIEIHGQHVYQVGALELLVHNACAPLRGNMLNASTVFEAGEQAAHIVPLNGWKWAGRGLQEIISKVKGAGLIDDVANGFKATSGHLGTHTKDYVGVLVEVMGKAQTHDEILSGLSKMRDLIMKGTFR